MNIMKLKYFLAVSRLGSLSRASVQMHISQPTLSSVIKELEEEYGVTLFTRHKRGMELTREGDTLYKLASDIVERAELADDRMRELGRGKTKITIGVPPMIGSLCLSKIYGEFVRENSDIEIAIHEGGREELLEEVRCERIDGAFIPHDLPISGEYSPIYIGRLETVLCACTGSPVLNYPSVDPENIKDFTLVLFEDGFLHTGKIKRWFDAHGVTPKILFQTTQLSTIVSIIRENIGVGFLFRELAALYPEISSRPLDTPMYTDVSFIFKRTDYPSHSCAKLTEYIKGTSFFEK